MAFTLEKAGWYAITNEEHHAQPAISSSGLKMFCQSPEKYYHRYVKRDWKLDSYSTAFLIGTCVHMLILEPEKAEHDIAFCDEKSTTKKYKEFVHETFDVDWDHPSNGCGRFMHKNGHHVYVLHTSTYEQVHAMAKKAYNHKLFRLLTESCVAETSGFAKYRDSWLSCRGDLRSTGSGENRYFIDVKTIENISEYALQSQLFSLGYHIQHLHYLNVANLIEGADLYKRFYFFFIEKNFPHECRLVHLDATDGEMGSLKQKYFEKLHQLQDSIARDDWQNPAKEKCGRIRIPSWVLDRFI
jgi:hypothetical protein